MPCICISWADTGIVGVCSSMQSNPTTTIDFFPDVLGSDANADPGEYPNGCQEPDTSSCSYTNSGNQLYQLSQDFQSMDCGLSESQLVAASPSSLDSLVYTNIFPEY